MAIPEPGEGELEPLEAVLERLQEEWLSGARIDLDRFCAEHAQYGPELRERIEGFLYVAEGLRETRSATAPEEAAGAAPEHLEERVLGDFRLLREVGRGGMGVVYEAEQISLSRRVAVKVLSPSLTAAPRAVERFRREAGVISRLRHPGIVQVFQVGQATGEQFFAMEFVAGTPLDEVIERARRGKGSIDPTWACRVISQVADALEHAHRAGVIHRDVKPSNIIVLENGTAKLTDFGLARQTGLPTLTLPGEFAGTAHYIAPEQAETASLSSDPRTDVYSLGVTLYELLTLRRPFEGETAAAVLRQVVLREPIPPRRINRLIPKDLETICLMAMEKQPGRRYERAADLAEDLRSFLELRPVRARPVGAVTRALRWARRRPALALSVVLTLLICLGAPALVFLLWLPSERERARETAENSINGRIDRSRTFRETHNSLESLVLAEQALVEAAEAKTSIGEACQNWYQAWLHLYRGSDGPEAASEPYREVSLLTGHTGPIRSGRFSPDATKAVTCSDDCSAIVWTKKPAADDAFWTRLCTLDGHEHPVIDALFNATATRVATLSLDGSLVIWDLSGAQPVVRQALDGYRGPPENTVHPPLLALLPQAESFVLAGGFDFAVHLFDFEGKELRRFPSRDHLEHAHLDVVWCVAVDSTGKQLVTSSRDRTARLWNLDTGDCVRVTPAPERQDQGLVCWADLLHSEDSGTDSILTLLTGGGACLQPIGPSGPVSVPRRGPQPTCASTESRNHRAAVGFQDGSACVIHGSAQSPYWLSPSDGAVTALAFHPRDPILAIGDVGGRVAIWEPSTERRRFVLGGHAKEVTSLRFSSRGEYLLTCSADCTARIWDTAGRPRYPYVLSVATEADSPIVFVALTTDPSRARTILCAAWQPSPAPLEGHITAWDVTDSKEPKPLWGPHTLPPINAIWSHGCTFVVAPASSDASGLVALDALTGERRPPPPPFPLSPATLRSDKKTIALAGDSLTLLHDVGHFSLSPDGRFLLTAPVLGGDVRICPTTALAFEHTRPLPHGDRVLATAYDSTSSLVVTACADKSAAVWNLATCQRLAHLPGHTQPLTSVAVDPTDSWAATGARDGTVRLWPLPRLQDVAALARDRPPPAPQQALAVIEKFVRFGPASSSTYHRAEPSPYDLANEAWRLVDSQDRPTKLYEDARDRAERAISSWPDVWDFHLTLGIAHYRLGNLPDADDALDTAQKLLFRQSNVGCPVLLLFRAIIAHQSGDVALAKGLLKDVKEPPSDKPLFRRTGDDASFQGFLEEAQLLIADR